MKKLISIILLCATAVLLSACGSAAPDKSSSGGSAVPPMQTAESYIGKEVSELYDAIGEPESVSYASSCLGSGEDGELVYNGFTVYTYKEGDSEVVQNVQ